jgi:hypothetical protein
MKHTQLCIGNLESIASGTGEMEISMQSLRNDREKREVR